MTDLDQLTIGEARQRMEEARQRMEDAEKDLQALRALFGKENDAKPAAKTLDEPIPVVVCTDKRGVVFGYTDQPCADPVSLTRARMCLYWDETVGGVFGLSEVGPNSDCKVSATTERVTLTGVTAVFDMTDIAVAAWVSAAVRGR